MSASTDPLIAELDAIARSTAVATRVAGVLERVERRLASKPDAAMTWESISLDLYGPGLPEDIRSCWVFTLRAGAATGAERHPNSHQRSFSLRGRGEFQLRDRSRWHSHPLSSEPGAPPGLRWVSIPANTWHRLFVADQSWSMLSFHTVAAEALVEERPEDPDDLEDGPTRRRLYQDEHG